MLHAFALSRSEEAAPSIDFKGLWVNQLGSSMTLGVSSTGAVTGTYRTKVGKPPEDQEFDLVGFATGDLLSFTVNFGVFGSLTSWVGQHTTLHGVGTIRTLWHLARNVRDADESDELWGAILAGADNFTREV